MILSYFRILKFNLASFGPSRGALFMLTTELPAKENFSE
jgi:hypothetical protein